MLTAAGPELQHASILFADGRSSRSGRKRRSACRRRRGGRHRQVRDPRHDRHPQSPRRLLGARHREPERWQRGHQSGDRAGVGRAFVLAAGPADSARDRGRDHRDPGAAGLGQPDRRALGHAPARARAHGAGDEASRRAVRAQDGVRREPQARLRGGRAPRPGWATSPATGQAFTEARGLRRKWKEWRRSHGEDPPERDLKLETLAEVLAGEDPGAEPLLPRRRDGADDRPRATSSASTSARSTTRSRRTRSPTCSRGTASPPRSGPTGGASRWSRSTASPRTRRCSSGRRRVRSCTPTPRTASSGSTRTRRKRCGRGTMRHTGLPGAGDPLDHRQPRLDPRHRLDHRHAGEAARRPTSWSGRATRSRSTARPRQVWNDGRDGVRPGDPKKQWRTDFNLGTGAPGVGQ